MDSMGSCCCHERPVVALLQLKRRQEDVIYQDISTMNKLGPHGYGRLAVYLRTHLAELATTKNQKAISQQGDCTNSIYTLGPSL